MENQTDATAAESAPGLGSPPVTVRSAADAMMKVIDQISQLDAKGLRSLIAQCDRLTQTNCWWLEYRLAPLIKQEAQEHLSLAEKSDEAENMAPVRTKEAKKDDEKH